MFNNLIDVRQVTVGERGLLKLVMRNPTMMLLAIEHISFNLNQFRIYVLNLNPPNRGID